MAEKDLEDTSQQEEIPADRLELEAEARKFGWRRAEEFTKTPSSWVDADRFLELPATRLKQQRDETARVQKELDSIKKMTAGLAQATDAAIRQMQNQERERFEAELAQIRAQKEAAASEGNLEQYKSLDKIESTMRPPQPAPVALDMGDAPEWTKDPVLVAAAYDAVERNPAAKSLNRNQQFEYAEGHLRTLFPSKFKTIEEPVKVETNKFSRVDAGSAIGGTASTGTSFNDIPSDIRNDARAAFEIIKKRGVKMTEAEYVKSYLGK